MKTTYLGTPFFFEFLFCPPTPHHHHHNHTMYRCCRQQTRNKQFIYNEHLLSFTSWAAIPCADLYTLTTYYYYIIESDKSDSDCDFCAAIFRFLFTYQNARRRQTTGIAIVRNITLGFTHSTTLLAAVCLWSSKRAVLCI